MARRLNAARNDKVFYMYGITERPVDSAKIVGIDGEPLVETIACSGLICWLSRVSKSEFADDLAANMENLDWLAPMSSRHQQTVSSIAEVADILPARFGTVFLSEKSLRADIQNRVPQLLADFKRIRGCEEWGVKVFTAQPAKVQLPVALKTGTDYLKVKSAILHSRTRKAPDEEIDRFAQALEKLSETAAEGGSITGGRRDLVFQVSLLLKRANRKKLAAILKRFSSQWKNSRQIECTGPWPPYSFVSRSV